MTSNALLDCSFTSSCRHVFQLQLSSTVTILEQFCRLLDIKWQIAPFEYTSYPRDSPLEAFWPWWPVIVRRYWCGTACCLWWQCLSTNSAACGLLEVCSFFPSLPLFYPQKNPKNPPNKVFPNGACSASLAFIKQVPEQRRQHKTAFVVYWEWI